MGAPPRAPDDGETRPGSGISPQGGGPPPLSPTARVILGMIGLGKTTGYEIKQLVDHSTRFFWAASYGQIYPELRRLEVAGLLGSHQEPTGGRARTVYELTASGRAALEQWLVSDADLAGEMR